MGQKIEHGPVLDRPRHSQLHRLQKILQRPPAAAKGADVADGTHRNFHKSRGINVRLGFRLYGRWKIIGKENVPRTGGLLLAQSGLLGADRLPRMQQVVELASRLQPELGASTRIYCVDAYIQPIPFYLKRPCTLVGYRGELDFGLQQEPWRFIPSLTDFAAVWRQQQDALAILNPGDYQQLEALGTPMRLIYTAPSYVAVARK